MMLATALKNFLVLLFAQVIAGKCTTPNNEEADCVSIYKCPVLLNALATNPSASKEFIKLSNCGGTSGEPLVCCGSSASLNDLENNAPSKGRCTTPNNEDVDCISIYKCPVLLNALAANSSASKEFVKLSNCGGKSGEPLVCCGSSSSLKAPSKGKCITPNNEDADCISIYKCPVLLNALATNSSASKEFVKLSNCGGTSGEPLVCCGSLSNLNASENNATSKGKCTTPNNEDADCVSIYKCPVLLNALATNSSASKEFVKLSNCGGTSGEPLVCCGSLSSLNASGNNAPSKTKCITPNNEEADCVSIYKCPVLLNTLLATKLSASQEEFIRLSKCGGKSGEPLVCCGSLSRLNATENNAPSNVETVYTKRLLAQRRYCGYQHFDDYYHAGNSTGLDEFPWLALLLFKDLNNHMAAPNIRCSGSLLGQKYVLTAAHCVTHARYNLTAVRFGEYNLDKSEDCIEGYPEECSDPTEDFDIEKIIPHPGYTNSPTHILNDIALIRLTKQVEYSDYIRPICLPVPEIKRAEIDDVLTTSGWGRTADGTLASIKKRISIRLITNTLCEEKYRALRQGTKGGHFCTVGVNDIDLSCVGDNGAPVMFANRYQWHLEGINSYGIIPCDPEFPNVNTKVVNYLDWIEGNILP